MLKYILSDTELAQLGFIDNTKVFGEHGEYKIYLTIRKFISINDWDIHTTNILLFYQSNPVEYMMDYCVFELNRKTGDIRSKDINVYSAETLTDEAYFTYKDKWSEIVIYNPIFKEVIKDINILTKHSI